LKGNFVVDEFEHSALYERDKQQIVMRLIAKSNQKVRLEKLSADFEIHVDEVIQTEISRKFNIETMNDLLSQANFNVVHTFSSTDDYFSLALATCA
ncbi:MAG: L-histidine N(alpha)-methyltransferase, partial [Rhodospirillaceae bacterium]|nr:L-histidine N(alpha)-methyltransferase [Rhodospirillaceae bacterium]